MNRTGSIVEQYKPLSLLLADSPLSVSNEYTTLLDSPVPLDAVPTLTQPITIDGDHSDWLGQNPLIYKNAKKELWMLKDDLFGYFLFRDFAQDAIRSRYYANLGVRPINPEVEEDRDHQPFLICFNLYRKDAAMTYWDYDKKKWLDVSGYKMLKCCDFPDDLWAVRGGNEKLRVEVKYPLYGDESRNLPPIVINDEGIAGLYASIEPMGPDNFPVFYNNVFDPSTFKAAMIPEFLKNPGLVAAAAVGIGMFGLALFKHRRMNQMRESNER